MMATTSAHTLSDPASAPSSRHAAITTAVTLTWLANGLPARSPLRFVAAAGAVAEAAAHIPVVEDHLNEAPYIGVCFVLLVVAGFMLAQLLLNADTRAVWVSVAAVSTVALLGYALSRSVGLPQIRDDIGHWTDPLGITAIIGEALMLLCAIMHLTHNSIQRMRKNT